MKAIIIKVPFERFSAIGNVSSTENYKPTGIIAVTNPPRKNIFIATNIVLSVGKTTIPNPSDTLAPAHINFVKSLYLMILSMNKEIIKPNNSPLTILVIPKSATFLLVK